MPLPEPYFLSSTLSGSTLLEAAVMMLVFFAALFAGSILLPGRQVAGPDVQGKPNSYKLNGFTLFVLTVIVGLLAQILGWFSLAALYTHFTALFVVANGFAFALSGWLYWRGSRGGDASPGIWRGFFFGVELNPSWLGVDLKLSATGHP